MWSGAAKSSIAVQTAPDCAISARRPRNTGTSVIDALRPMSVRTRPNAPGPTSRMPRRTANLRNVSRPFALLGSVSGRGIGQQNRSAHTGVRAIVEHVADRTRGRCDDCEIDGLTDRADPRPGLAAEHFAMSGIDHVQVARERTGKRVLEHDASQRPRSFGRADQRNAAWQQQRAEIVLLQPIGRHGVPAAGSVPR